VAVAVRRRPLLGVIVNPIAGMGGRVGLRGTDGPDLLRRAVERGAVPAAAGRFEQALRRLRPESLDLVAAPGEMGAAPAEVLGFEPELAAVAPTADEARPTGREDTLAAAAAMAARRVDLLLFAGGDGTARDILEATGGAVPVLGVPTGVKMHSGVFAASPTRAGNAARAFLADRSARERLLDGEVVDAADGSHGSSGVRLYGRLPVPAGRLGALPAKSAAPAAGAANLEALCREVAAEVDDGRLCILGPGTTTDRIERCLGVEGSLLGVDAVRGRELIGSDLSERDLLALLDEEADARLVVGVIGGQGSLFGRGNQQLSPEVLKRFGGERIVVVCEQEKLLGLATPRLHVDTGDATVDRRLSGHRRIRVAPRRETVIEVSA
jgi:predicted polyphosphate/ATP-dependent NAD kinase